MASDPQAERSPRQFTEPLREFVALVLVGATAVFLLVALIRLVPGSDPADGFTERSQAGFNNVVNLATIALPILAVLLVTHLGPETGRARLITTVALAEYAAAAFFGVLFGFFVGLIRAAEVSFRFAFEEFLTKVAWLALLGVVGYVVYQLWRGRYQPVKPKPVQEPYGGPRYGAPQQPWDDHPAPPPPGQWGRQAPPPPGQWGQPVQQSPPPPGQWGEPTQGAQPGQWGQAPQSVPLAPDRPYPPAGSYEPPAAPYGYGRHPGAGDSFSEPTEMYGRRTRGREDTGRGPDDPAAYR